MHVAVTNVTVSHHPGHLTTQPFPHHGDGVVEDGEGEGDVVLEAVTVLRTGANQKILFSFLASS